MKITKMLVLVATGSLLSVGAFAHDKGPNAQQQAAGLQTLTFEDLKGACQNPAQYHNQTAPSNIQITCSDVQAKWVAVDQGNVPMATAHLVTASIASDKYTSTTVSEERESAQQVMSCPNFKEVAENVQTVRAVSCDDILAYKGSVADFCTDAAESVRSANPASIQSADTGRTMSLCGGAVTRVQSNAQQSSNAQKFR